MISESVWSGRRARLCLKAGVTNLNAGSCSPTSRDVLDAVLRMELNKAEDPVSFVFRQTPILAERARQALADYLGCQPRCLLLMQNATYAVNTLARSLPWQAGDELLLSDQEYHHYLSLWQRIARERGIKLRQFAIPSPSEQEALTPADITARFAEALTAKTRAVFVSHVTSPTGLCLPVKEICALARERGLWSIIDGAHAPGLVDVRLSKDAIDADFYFANVHKWMMGATGAAFLYVREPLRQLIKPLITTAAFDGAEGDIDLDEKVQAGPSRWCKSHEYQGTRNLIPTLVIPNVIGFLNEIPQAAVDQRTRALARYTRQRLGGLRLGLIPASHAHEQLATCMVAFRAPPELVAKAGGSLGERANLYLREHHQIEANFPHLQDGTPLLRVSCAWFNTRDEVDALANTLEGLDWSRLQHFC